jgi:outer membrane protein TolC
MIKKLFLVAAIIISILTEAQVPLTIDSCYARARQQYPLIKQKGLIDKTREYNIENAGKGYYPQFSINGQATYQDPVTSIPFNLNIPKLGIDISIPTYSKDQYKIDAQLDQVIYDGGAIKYSKESFIESSKIDQQNLEVQLYALKDRINQIFFGVLLMDEQIKQNDLTQKDIQTSIDKIQEQVKNGTALNSAVYEIQASLLQQEQNKIQLKASRKAYLDMLGVFINHQLDEKTSLAMPNGLVISSDIKRPELNLYDEQKRIFDIQQEMLNVSNRPKFSFFLQGGYGRPGLNAFDNNFAPWYIGGVRLNWQFGGFYTLKNQKQLLDINRQTTDIQKETFLFNTNITLKQQNTDIEKLKAMVDKDNEIIAKRTEVKDAAKSQMENGVVTMHEYINQLDAEDLAKRALLLHEVQLLLAEYSYQNTSGN